MLPAQLAASLALVESATAREGSSLMTLLLTWAPILLILVAWFWFMSRSGVSRHKMLQDRSLGHMARLEEQNREILETLKRIEKLLGDRPIDPGS